MTNGFFSVAVSPKLFQLGDSDVQISVLFCG